MVSSERMGLKFHWKRESSWCQLCHRWWHRRCHQWRPSWCHDDTGFSVSMNALLRPSNNFTDYAYWWYGAICFLEWRWIDCWASLVIQLTMHINELVQDCSISSASKMKIPQSCTKTLICFLDSYQLTYNIRNLSDNIMCHWPTNKICSLLLF